jgi:hypothetical protein
LVVFEVDGRTVAVQPDLQMVWLMLACVEPLLIVAGVQCGSGSGCPLR